MRRTFTEQMSDMLELFPKGDHKAKEAAIRLLSERNAEISTLRTKLEQAEREMGKFSSMWCEAEKERNAAQAEGEANELGKDVERLSGLWRSEEAKADALAEIVRELYNYAYFLRDWLKDKLKQKGLEGVLEKEAE